VLLALVVLLLPSTREAAACSCAPQPDPVAAATEATAVFFGELKGLEASELGILMKFRVIERIKGPDGAEIGVQTAASDGLCALPLPPIGGRIVVYAHGEGEELSTGLCSRTSQVEDPVREMEILRAHFGAGSPGGVTPSDGSDTTTEEIAVYHDLIRELFVSSDTELLLLRPTVRTSADALRRSREKVVEEMRKTMPGAPVPWFLKEEPHGTIDDGAVADYVRKAPLPTLLDRDLGLGLEVKLVPPEGEAPARELKKAGRVFTLSRVGFNAAGDRAAVEVGVDCGPGCSQSEVILLRKRVGVWEVDQRGLLTHS